MALEAVNPATAFREIDGDERHGNPFSARKIRTRRELGEDGA